MAFKKISLSFIFCSLFFSLQAQTPDEIINKYIRFIGGSENWKAVSTMAIKGMYNYVGVSFPFVSYAKRPDLYIYTVTANGKSFTQAFNGTEGWRIDGFKDEKEKTILKGDEAYAMANETDVELESPFINYQVKGHKVESAGTDTSGGKTAYKIRLTRKNGQSETYFFQATDFALVKKVTVSRNSEMEKAPLDVIYSDYKATGKIKIPRKIACSTNGQPVLTIVVDTVELNLPVKDEMFRP